MIIRADARQIPLRDDVVDCCVTSPPYWGLRDYGTAGQLGLERTPEEYVANMVAVFQEVRRVLKANGTLWLNLGDSYWNHSPVRKSSKESFEMSFTGGKISDGPTARRTANGHDTLKMKDLVGIPWRVAFALQADGWWLRSDIIWAKPNPMPESVTDRPTKAHEYVFLLTKSERYYYDAKAIAEPFEYGDHSRRKSGNKERKTGEERGRPGSHLGGSIPWEENGAGRNKRSVWNIATQPYRGAHFATMPEALARVCIKAGCPPGGLVLDPFGGSGTTAQVALEENCKAILCDIGYQDIQLQRLREIQPNLKPAD